MPDGVWRVAVRRVERAGSHLGGHGPRTGDLAAGVLPQLSVLEMLLHPGRVRVLANTALLLAGTVEILPIELPMAILDHGPARVVPVQITGLAITEQAHDPALVPIRAEVDVSAAVLTCDDLEVTSSGYGLSVAHLVAEEVLSSVPCRASRSPTPGRCP